MADSVHKQVIDAFVAKAKTLSLAGLGNDQIREAWDVTPEQLTGMKLPALLFSPAGNEEDLGGTNERDDIGYPVAALFLDRHPVTDPSNMDKALLWRQKVRRAFIQQRLSGVSSVYIVRYRSGPVVVQVPGAYQLLTQPLTFVAVSREARG